MTREINAEVYMMEKELFEAGNLETEFPAKGKSRDDRRTRTETAKEYANAVKAVLKAAEKREEITQGKGKKGDKVYMLLPGYTQKGIVVSIPTKNLNGVDPVGKSRRKAKADCRKFKADDFDFDTAYAEYAEAVHESEIRADAYDEVINPWGYTEDEIDELGVMIIHGDFTDDDINALIKVYNPDHYERMWAAWGEDDDDDFGFDPYQSALDDREKAWEEISELTKEINKYKDFLGEFNLTTLYQRWLADNGAI